MHVVVRLLARTKINWICPPRIRIERNENEKWKTLKKKNQNSNMKLWISEMHDEKWNPMATVKRDEVA